MMTRYEFEQSMKGTHLSSFKGKLALAETKAAEIRAQLGRAVPDSSYAQQTAYLLADAQKVVDRWKGHVTSAAAGRLQEADADHLDPIHRREMRDTIAAAYALSAVDHHAEERGSN